MDSENDLILYILVGLLLLIVYFKYVCKKTPSSEYLDNVASDVKMDSFNPRARNPQINQQAEDNGYIVLPNTADAPWAENKGGYGETDALMPVDMGLNFNMCSKACCSNGTYPPPFSLTPDDYVLMSGQEFVGSPYSCNNSWQDSGCLCLTREQANNLNSRGGNAKNRDL
jgi:hypothetical protein